MVHCSWAVKVGLHGAARGSLLQAPSPTLCTCCNNAKEALGLAENQGTSLLVVLQR